MSASFPDRDYADYFANCRTTPLHATSSRLSAPGAAPVCNSAASESDNSRATKFPRFRRHAQYRIQIVFRADAYAEKNLAASHRWAAFPEPERENRPLPAEPSTRDYSIAM